LRTLFDLVKSLVDDALGHRLLAVPHHRVDEFSDERAVVNRIGQDFAFWDFSSSWHISFLIRISAAGTAERASISGTARLRSRRCRLDSCSLPLLGAAPAAASFGRFAPYFERPCLRLATPTESSVPRTM